MSRFKVQGELSLDGSKFAAGLNHAQLAAGRFANKVTHEIGGHLAAIFSLGMMEEGIRRTVEYAGALRDMADATRLNVEWFQKFAEAVRQTGGHDEDIRNFAMRLEQSRQEAVNNPEGKQAQGFKALGVSDTEVRTLNPQAMIGKIIAAFKNGADTNLVNAVTDVGGKAARNLVNAFAQGVDESTRVMTDETVDALDEAGDSFESLKTQLLVDLAPAIVSIMTTLREWYDTMTIGRAVVGDFMGSMFAAVSEFFTTFKSGHPIKAVEDFGKAMADATQSAHDAGMEEAIRVAEQDKNRAAGLAARKEARRHREGDDENIIPTVPGQTGTMKALQGGGLISVGNFLGSSQQLIVSLAQRQVQLLTSIEKNTKKSADNGNGNSLDNEFP